MTDLYPIGARVLAGDRTRTIPTEPEAITPLTGREYSPSTKCCLRCGQ